jgi:hypothetical protein
MLSVSLYCTFCVCQRGRQTQNVQSRETDNIGYTTGNMRKTIKNVQCRETDNIGYTTGNMRKTIKNVQSRDTDNIGYTTRYKRKTNTERLSVSLDCTFCVCLPLMSCCITNVVSVSGLYILCLSSSYVLYTQCCRFLWIVHSVFVFVLCVQSRETDNIGYTTRHKRKTNTECTIQRK